MVMTLKLMEKMMIDEDENLHLRIDQLSERFDVLEARIDKLELRIDSIDRRLDELHSMIALNYPTKNEVEEIVERTVKRLLETYLAPFTKLLEG